MNVCHWKGREKAGEHTHTAQSIVVTVKSFRTI